MDIGSRIFVAGGTGMVGSAIIRQLRAAGFKTIVTNYYRRAPTAAEGDTAGVAWYRVDLTNQAETEAFFESHKPEYVFLAAAKVGGILANSTYKADFIYENLAIAAHVVHTAYRYGVTKLLNLGSSCIYPRLAPQPMKEEDLLTGELEPTNEAYAVAKIAAIKLCRYYNEQYRTNFISAMPTNLYGPRDNFDLENSHVLPALIRKFHLARLFEADDVRSIEADFRLFGNDLAVGKPSPENLAQHLSRFGIAKSSVTIWGTGEPYREFLHVDDLARACVFLMENYDYPELGEFINVGAGTDMRIKDLAEMARSIVGFDGQIEHDLSKPDGMPRKLLDTSRITRLGWRPEITLKEGISSVYDWYREASASDNVSTLATG